MPDKDELVRKVIVQPLKRKYQKTTPAPRERAIHDLVLLKSLITPEASEPNNTKDSPLLNEDASILMTSLQEDDLDLCPRTLDKIVPFSPTIPHQTNVIRDESDSTIESREDSSSSSKDHMPAGPFQQETRELATACWDPQVEEDQPLPLEIGNSLTHQTESVESTYNAEEIDCLQSTASGLLTHIQKLRSDDSSSSSPIHPSNSPITTEAIIHQEQMDAPSLTPNQTPKTFSSSNVSRPSVETDTITTLHSNNVIKCDF